MMTKNEIKKWLDKIKIKKNDRILGNFVLTEDSWYAITDGYTPDEVIKTILEGIVDHFKEVIKKEKTIKKKTKK